jgi:hypothetical protein
MAQNNQVLLTRLKDSGLESFNLDALIASKSAVGREKDLEAVRLLRAIKETKK